jgi:hypothetical protein
LPPKIGLLTPMPAIDAVAIHDAIAAVWTLVDERNNDISGSRALGFG